MTEEELKAFEDTNVYIYFQPHGESVTLDGTFADSGELRKIADELDRLRSQADQPQERTLQPA